MTHRTGTVYIDSPDEEDQQKSQLDDDSDSAKLNDLAQRAGWIIFETSSGSSLLSPFRNKLTICPNRVTITKRGLFYRYEYPMPIENITNARVYTHFLSTTITIETFGIPTPDPIKSLGSSDARLARRYILALIECNKADIDLTGLNLDQLRDKLQSIGMVQHGSS